MNYTEHLESDLFDVTAERDELLGLLRETRKCRYISECQECPKRIDAALKRNGERMSQSEQTKRLYDERY